MLNPKSLKCSCEQYEEYRCAIWRRKIVRYDYRADDGELFSCVRRSLEECRTARDRWAENREKA